MKNGALIVGGGMAGLSCALHLHRAGFPFHLLEASDRLGGRVATDRVDGYVLDRGFQVFLDAYPTAGRILDLPRLQLKPFQSGALIPRKGGFGVVADPVRHPTRLLSTLTGPLPLADLLLLARLNFSLRTLEVEAALSVKDQSTAIFLQEYGFSERCIERFWRPFLGGIFLEAGLETSSRMFHMVTSLFARGRATLPAAGMRAIPDQLEEALPPMSLRTGCRAVELGPQQVRLDSGELLEAEHVVDARDVWSAEEEPAPACGTRCFYFAADAPPWKKPWLVLCPESRHLQTLTYPTLLHPGHAPEGKHLLSVSTLRMDTREEDVRADLAGIFGRRAAAWPLIKSYAIPHALPGQGVGQLNPASRTGKNRQGVYRCGDHLETASIEGALLSGKRAAEHILAVSRHR